MTDYIAMRQGRARADRRDRQGHRRGVRRGRLRPGRRRDRRAPRPAGARRVRRRGRRHRCGRGRRPARPGIVSRPGDVVVAMASSGLHSNGYSLVRHVLLAEARLGARPATCPSSAGRWARSCSSRPGSMPGPAWPWPRRDGIHAMAHVTGGGLAANLARVLPVELDRHGRPRHLDPAAGLRPGPPGSATYPSPTSRPPSTAASAWSPCSTRQPSTPRSRCSADSGSTPGWPARWQPHPAPAAPSSWSASTPVGKTCP